MPDPPNSPSFMSRVHATVDRYFLITERGTTIMTEIRAGTAAFLTMSYLLLVNPQIMAQAGVDHDDAVFATALSSAAATFVVGVGGNLPFGLAPGLGLSAYLTYGLILSGSATLQESMTACLASGMLLALCAFSGLTGWIMRVVPSSIKLAIVVGMGLLIAMIGMVSVNLVVGNRDTLVALGNLSDQSLQLCLVGLVLIGSLLFHKITGSILLGIAAMTLVFWQINDTYPTDIARAPTLKSSISDFLDLRTLLDRSQAHVIYPSILAFLCICIFDISGVMFGLSTLAGLIQEDGTVPRSIWTFVGSSIGTLIAAATGSTPIIITVECAAGIKEGGRTGLTALTISGYFLASIFFSPLFSAVPAEATAPVLILVGAMMMGESKKIEWEDITDSIPAFLTITMMPLTYSITNGMMFGLAAAAAFYITTGTVFRDLRGVLCPRPVTPEEDGSVLAVDGVGSGHQVDGIILSETLQTEYRNSSLARSDASEGTIDVSESMANGMILHSKYGSNDPV